MESLSVQDRKKAALFGLFVADATAMPVHWMYDLRNLKRDYGEITGYAKPLDKFDGSIMNLSNTGGGGRGSADGDIVGTVILHGKKKYWERGVSYHYHCGMQAGENTLEAQLTRLAIRHMNQSGKFDADVYREEYMKFMQNPGNHNDTYAATAHRMFFKNLVDGKEPKKCPDNDGHNVDSIDALTVAIPVVLQYAEDDREVRNAKVLESIRVIRGIKKVEPYAIVMSDMIVDILNGKALQTACQEAATKIGFGDLKAMVEQQRGDPMVACYIDSSFPAMLFMVYKYAASVEKAILASANAGGENVARGAILGTLLGAAHGMGQFPEWTHGLYEKDKIMAEIDQFVTKK